MKKLLVLAPTCFVAPDDPSGVPPNKKYYSIVTDIGTLAMYAKPQMALYLCETLRNANVQCSMHEMELHERLDMGAPWHIRVINSDIDHTIIETIAGDSYVARTIAVLLSMEFRRHEVHVMNENIKEGVFVNGAEIK